MAEAAKERGNALYKAGKFEDAVKAYDESIAADPAIAAAHANRAAALTAMGRAKFNDATVACVEALCLDPSYGRAKSRLGALCVKLGDLEPAVAAAEGRARSHPDHSPSSSLAKALRLLRDGRAAGNAAFKSGDVARALKTYSDAMLAAAAEAAGSDAAAAGAMDAEALCVAVPGAALLMCNRAACAASLGRHADALTDATAALRADPEYAKASLRAAHARKALGEHAAAAAIFAELRERLPGDASVADELNACRRAAGGDLAKLPTERAGVIEIESMERYRALIAKAPLCLIDFTAKWCGPCKQVAPHFAAMALANPTIHFLKVDVDERQDISAAENVRSMPTFKAYRYGAKVDEFSGADLGRLQGLVARYLPTLS